MLKVGGHASTGCHARGCDSPSNAAEVMSKQHDPHLTRLLGKQACAYEGSLDHSSHSRRSSKTPKFEDSKTRDQEQVETEIPFRKARVSVRARSEAPLVIFLFFFILNIS